MKRVVYIILFFLLICCKEENDPFTEVDDLVRDYKFEKAIVKLNTMEKRDPKITYYGKNIPLLKAKCYENLGDFNTAGEEFEKANKLYDPKYVIYAYDTYDSYFSRFYIKNLFLEDGLVILNKFNNLDWDKLSEKEKYVFMPIKDDLLIDYIAEISASYNDKKNESLTDYIDIIFNIQKEIWNNKKYTKRILFDLLNYQFVDGKFYVDMIWDMDVTKKYFKIFYEKKLIDKNTPKELLKVLPTRKELPESFLALFKEMK